MILICVVNQHKFLSLPIVVHFMQGHFCSSIWASFGFTLGSCSKLRHDRYFLNRHETLIEVRQLGDVFLKCKLASRHGF